MAVSVKESLQIEQACVKEFYPIQILRKGKNFRVADENNAHAQFILLYGTDEEKNAFLFQPENGLYPSLFDFQQEKHIFLSGSSGMGKTFLLQDQNGLYLSLASYQKEIRKAIFLDVSCWILVQILLKYHYQYEYETYEICSACEGEENLLQQLSELLKLFQNGTPNYTLLLDGMNEISPELQDVFIDELQVICEKWNNVRIVVSGRNYPFQDVFQNFEKFTMEGIPKSVKKIILSDFPQAIEDSHLFKILTIPLFMHYFLNANYNKFHTHTRGEILDFYFENTIKKYHKSIQFIVKYALPFLAYETNLHLIFKRSEVANSVQKAVEIFINQETVWQDVIAPEGFRKQVLLNSLQSIDFVEILIEQLQIFRIVHGCELQFSHEYIRNYFCAKYVLNAVKTIALCYDREPEKKKLLFNQFGLNTIWWHTEDEPYILIGEICGDYLNIPDKNGAFNYQRTELDMLLDFARTFHANTISENVIRVMKFSRNYLICGVDFSRLAISVFLLSDIKFSNRGSYPSNFNGCKIFAISEDNASFQNCDFRGCDYMFDLKAKEKLRNMGAIVD